MDRLLNVVFVLIIIFGLYVGVRYVGSVIHYACADPAEDCAPPIYGVGEMGWYATGGSLVPLWRQG
jgi:hypothetical protein